MRLTSESSGGVKCRTAGIRPRSDTEDRRTMARARKPRGRSRRLAQPIPTATPRTMNASASTFCMNATTPLIEPASCRTEAVDGRDLTGEKADEFGVPLPARTAGEDGERLALRHLRPVRAVVGQRVECVADRDDPRQQRYGCASQAVGIAPAVPGFVVVTDDRQQIGAGTQRADDDLADFGVSPHQHQLVSIE